MFDQASGKPKRTLPPNQRIVKKILRWGIDHPAIIPEIPKLNQHDWRLVIEGEVKTPIQFNWIEFESLPYITSISDFHCVEGWSVLNCQWEGVQFRTLVEMVQPKESAQYVVFKCADEYTTSLHLVDLMDDEVVLAYRLNGKDLEPSLGGPLRLIVPNKYAYKNAMWITRISFRENHELGYWEKRGYSDKADVWENDRYSRS
jgi:DMSO/TMAO reductase YedYZ molybdopterin-dependent catalytic subunit